MDGIAQYGRFLCKRQYTRIEGNLNLCILLIKRMKDSSNLTAPSRKLLIKIRLVLSYYALSRSHHNENKLEKTLLSTLSTNERAMENHFSSFHLLWDDELIHPPALYPEVLETSVPVFFIEIVEVVVECCRDVPSTQQIDVHTHIVKY